VQALYTNSSGSFNTSLGKQALYTNTASNNTAVGYQAGYSQVGASNTFVGYQAGYTGSTSASRFNVYVGAGAGFTASGGEGNTFIGGGNNANGYPAGYLMTSGANNVIIGGFGGNQTLPITGNTLDIRTSSGNIVLSDGDGKAWLYVNSSGLVRMEGITSNTTGNAANVNCDAAGSLRQSTSALKYKTNVRDLASIDINKFRPVVYNSLCEDDDKTKDHFGFIADEVDQTGIKELISYDLKGEVNGFQYERMTVVLTKALQELNAKFDAYVASHP
jgi:hypothetical protein